LVDAEPERDEEGSQADMIGLPEPEPKFQVGQWVETQDLGEGLGDKFQIYNITWEDAGRRLYSGHGADEKFVRAWEDALEPRAPILTAEQEALRPGNMVESIEIPVGRDGVPVYLPLTALGAPTEIDTVLLLRSGDKMAQFANGRREWLWNLRLVKKAEPEEERAP